MNRSVLSIIAGAALLGLSKGGSKSSDDEDTSLLWRPHKALILSSTEDVHTAMSFDEREKSSYTKISIYFDEGILDGIPDGFFKGFNEVHQLDMDVVGAEVEEDSDDFYFDFEEQNEDIEVQRAENRRLFSGMNFSIPKDFSDLTSLKYFSANNMNIEIPISKTVEEIRLGNCFVVRFPNDMSKFESLEKIYIVNSDFTFLPESIGEVQSLYELEINMSGLKVLPQSVSNLRNLKTLSVWGNHLTELPESIGNLSSLETLNIGHPMSERVLEMANIASTSAADVMNNPNPLKRLPDSIARLNLQSLGITGLSLPPPSREQIIIFNKIKNREMLRKILQVYNMSNPSEIRRF